MELILVGPILVMSFSHSKFTEVSWLFKKISIIVDNTHFAKFKRIHTLILHKKV